MKNNVVRLDDYRPHIAMFVHCGKCSHIWIAVYPAITKQLECPRCSHMIPLSGKKHVE